MTKEELQALVKQSNSQSKSRGSGGQSVGMIARDVTLEIEGHIKIEIACFRSMMQNKILANTLMDVAIDELLIEINKQ